MANKVRVYTADLKEGMYVAELDRPWVGTPFLFQGFVIQNEEDIKELRTHCEFVYVDGELSKPDAVPHLLTSKQAVLGDKQIGVSSFSEAGFRKRLSESYGVYKDARKWIDTMLGDSRLGRSVDTKQARLLVTQLADQVIKNPDALIWLTYLKERDEYTATHCINVCILALSFGRELNLDQDSLHKLGMGTLLHDIGKMNVPEEILNKPGRLTKEEFEIIKAHPSDGHAMLITDHEIDPASLHVVLHHHERLDGGGYPNGLSEEEIPLLTRISSIVDVYDAITSDRCYHDAVSPATALENLFKWSSGNFDVSLLERFIKCLGIYPIGSVVQLNSGEVGVVVATDESRRLKPVVLLVLNSAGKLYERRRLVNLSSDMWENTGKPLSINKVFQPDATKINIKTILQDELQYSTS
jgi:HD-GYP domain-containing protein (c-di-GMP phosphodiesterase class II)